MTFEVGAPATRPAGTTRRRALGALRFGVLPAVGAAPPLAVGAVIGAILLLLEFGFAGAGSLWIMGAALVLLVLFAVGVGGLVVAFVLAFFRHTRPVAAGYFAGAFVAIAVDGFIYYAVPAIMNRVS
jgi:hypothetical protein